MHGTPEQQELIRKIVDTIVREYQPEAVILFGSFAWGEPTQDSDVDLVIIKDDNQLQLERRLFIRKIVRDLLTIGLDVMALNPVELEKHILNRHSFIELIWNKGEFLYGSSRRYSKVV